MAWEELGPEWQSLQQKLRQSSARALIVDDEEVVRDLLRDLLTMSRFEVEVAETAEAALQMARARPFDVLVTDKNLPGHDGVDLIAQLRAEGFGFPCILVTGYPSVDTISRALASGAADYIAKPFDDIRHVRQRIESVVEQHRTAAFLNRVVQDLKETVKRLGVGPERIGEIEQNLLAAKRALSRRPDVLLVEADPKLNQLLTLFLQGAGLSAVSAASEEEARRHLQLEERALSALVSLELPQAIALIGEMRDRDPQLEILASGRATRLEDAIGAVRAGAADFVLGANEGLELLTARVKRAAARARRRRLYHELIATLLRAARGSDLAEALGSLLAPSPTIAGPPSLPAGPGQAESPPPAPEGQPARAAPAPAEPSPPAPSPCAGAAASGSHGEALDEVDIDLSDLSEVLADPVLASDWGSQVGPMEAAVGAPAQPAIPSEAQHTSVEEQIRYGLDAVDPRRTVELPVRDLLQIVGTYRELIRFFHEPEHYATPERVEAFAGGSTEGALAVLTNAYYVLLRPRLPDDVRQALEARRFEHPRPPAYLKPPAPKAG